MTEPSVTNAPIPLPPSLLAIAGVQPLEMQVVDVEDLGPRMRRIRLGAGAFSSFEYRAGQDVMLVLAQEGERPLSRRYTIRDVDRARGLLELNVVLHGDVGPGARWVAGARPGARVNGVGPRGKIFINPDAAWHLFLGDESAAPASLAMLEALPPQVPGTAYIEVADGADELPYRAGARQQVHWLHRGADSRAVGQSLLQALESAALPGGRGHVYIAGEVQMVAMLRDAALRRGLEPEEVSAKAYWGRGRPNASRGEPD